MNAPPFPLNPSVGQWWQNWVWNGANWVCSQASGIRVLTTVFTASGPYMPSPGLVSLVVECVGGGGGGGGAAAQANIPPGPGWIMGGGGGGGGGYSRITLPAALVQGGVNVTIGAGGAGGLSTAQFGGAGGDTTFGGMCVAHGGASGQAGNLNIGNYWGAPGQGANAGTGDLAAPGNGGTIATSYYYPVDGEQGVAASGTGGRAFFGGGGTNWMAATAQTPGVNGNAGELGSGGDGGASGTMSAPANGGQGGDGICVVTEYCFADSASDGSDCVNPQTVNLNARLELDRTGWPGPKPPRPPGGGWGPYGQEGDDEG